MITAQDDGDSIIPVPSQVSVPPYFCILPNIWKLQQNIGFIRKQLNMLFTGALDSFWAIYSARLLHKSPGLKRCNGKWIKYGAFTSSLKGASTQSSAIRHEFKPVWGAGGVLYYKNQNIKIICRR